MKKIMSIILAMVMVLSLAACGAKEAAPAAETPATEAYVRPEIQKVERRSVCPLAETKDLENAADVKVGFIFLHDENSTYDRNFMDAAKAACKEMGVEYIEKVGVPETNECYEAAADLVDRGCTLIFADSFGHESFILQAAKEFPDVQFCHATGTMAHTENLKNFHNAFADIYTARYLAGIVAGMKLKEMIDAGEFKAEEAKVGYVGAYTYAEVISGYTSWFLGVRSIVPEATMEVQFTGSWYDEALEKEAANTLIGRGCKLISQHADSMGAPTACEEAGIPNVSYNGSTIDACPNTFLVSSRINWQPYLEYIIWAAATGNQIVNDWSGNFETESVMLTDINEDVCAAGTKEALIEAQKKIMSGELQIFDVNNFTVSNIDASTFTNHNAITDSSNKLTSYGGDVDTDEAYTCDTEAIDNNAFQESAYRSAPYFDIKIDGITLLNSAM